MEKINGLQALRGIAATAVVFSHAYTRAAVTWPHELQRSLLRRCYDLVWVGEFGVDLFFVLSGFLMAYLHRRQFGVPQASGAFLRRRILRIVPLYWLLSAVALILLFTRPALFSFHSSTEWPWIAGSFLFVPWPTSNGFFAPLIGAGWTLDYEMYFYLLFAAALFFRAGLAGLGVFLSASVVIGYLFSPSHPWVALLTGPLLLEFLMGMAVAWLVPRRRPRHPMVLVFLGTGWIVATAFKFPGEWRVLFWGLPSALLVAGTVWAVQSFGSLGGRFIVLLGDASYSIYLFQVFALPAFARIFAAGHLQEHLPIDILLLLIATCSCAAGVVVWKLIEQPLGRVARSIVMPRVNFGVPRAKAIAADRSRP